MNKTFKGGVHPKDNKKWTNGIPIEVLPAGETMVFPMSQHIGAICRPLVQKGDYVKVYQKIGDCDQFVSSPIFSSVSGEVVDVGPHMTAPGTMVTSVVVKNDFKDEKMEVSPPGKDYSLPDTARAAGLVGMGGAAFPTHVKLSPPENKKINIIIVNGSECEPYITSDHRVMVELGEKVVSGLRIVLEKMGVSRGVIAIEKNKPDAIANMREITANDRNIEVVGLKTKYPEGSEKQLIDVVTGCEVPSSGLPMDVGVIVLNVDTCASIYETVTFGTPLISRIITVSGPIVKNPKNFEARFGTSVKNLVEAAGGVTEPIRKIIMGGPMMGTAICSAGVPVVKGTSAVLCFGKSDAGLEKALPCIRCGRCITSCPMRLLPYQLCNYTEVRSWDNCKSLNVSDCIECGCCTYCCPSKRQIVQSIKLAKQMIREKKI